MGCPEQAAGLRHAGRKKVKLENQDFLCNEAHMSGARQERSLFGVFDGHGACGRAIAQHCSWLLPNFADVAVQEALQVSTSTSCSSAEAAAVLRSLGLGDSRRPAAGCCRLWGMRLCKKAHQASQSCKP